MKGAQYTINPVTGYVREFVFNPEMTDENGKKIRYNYDIKKEIPPNENQEGYWRDLENIDSFLEDSNQPWKTTNYPQYPIIRIWKSADERGTVHNQSCYRLRKRICVQSRDDRWKWEENSLWLWYIKKEIPPYENQEGYLRDLENIDSFWRILTTPEKPQITTQPNSPLPNSTPTLSTPEVAEVSIFASSILETPPVSLCLAPEKPKLDINF